MNDNLNTFDELIQIDDKYIARKELERNEALFIYEIKKNMTPEMVKYIESCFYSAKQKHCPNALPENINSYFILLGMKYFYAEIMQIVNLNLVKVDVEIDNKKTDLVKKGYGQLFAKFGAHFKCFFKRFYS